MLTEKMIAGMIMVVLASMNGTAWGITYHVYPYGVDDPNGGGQDTPFATIQYALDRANDGDVIKVNKGIYNETINFNGVCCTVSSANPNDWSVVVATIISANDTGYMIKFDSGEDANSVLTGFAVSNDDGSGIYCGNSSPVISNCIIENNNGNGIYCDTASPTIRNNRIRGNDASGIVYSSASAPSIENNWIYNNKYGIFFSGAGSAVLRNNTIVGNSKCGIFGVYGTAPAISNCILWDNGSDLHNCSATYSCIEDINETNGVGNITGNANNPLFVEPNNNDYHLNPNSPCIDAGEPNGTYTGAVDIDFAVRVLDGDNDGNSVIDMGADEYDPNP